MWWGQSNTIAEQDKQYTQNEALNTVQCSRSGFYQNWLDSITIVEHWPMESQEKWMEMEKKSHAQQQEPYSFVFLLACWNFENMSFFNRF